MKILLDGSEHFALIKGTIKKSVTPRVRVISSNVVQNYLNESTITKFISIKLLIILKDLIIVFLIFIKDTNLKSVTQTLKDYKNKDFYKKGKDKLIRNYGIGAQIIKDLKIKNMTLITKSPKKVIGLDGYGIKIVKQEINLMKKKYLIVVADYYQNIAKGLLDSALRLIPKSNLLKIIKVPGVFEIPVTISKNIKKYDGFFSAWLCN